MGGRVADENSVNLMNLAPRCNATAKRTRFKCQSPAVKGWSVCRMHGAGGGAQTGTQNGNYCHGGRTKRAMEASATVQAILRLCRQTIDDLP